MIRDEGKKCVLRGWKLYLQENTDGKKLLKINVLCYGNKSNSLQHEQLDFVMLSVTQNGTCLLNIL